jgi:hypothetical protein
VTTGTGVLAVIALAASLRQLGAVPTFFLAGIAAPLLPVAVIAAWATLRGEGDAWPALLVAAFVLGVASQLRVGWFMLALLPTSALCAVVVRQAGGRFAFAPAAAAGGAVAYLAVLSLAAARPATVLQPWEVLLAAAWTALAAALIALVLQPFHPRPRRLFE